MTPAIVVLSPHIEARSILVDILDDQACGSYHNLALDPAEASRIAEYNPVAVILDSLVLPDARAQLEASLASLSPSPPVIPMRQTNGLRRELGAAAEEQLVETLADYLPSLRRLRDVQLMAAESIERERKEIVARWLQRLETIPAFKAKPWLSLEELRDDVPLLIKALVRILREGAHPAMFEPGTEAYSGALGHARLRRDQHVPLHGLVQEYQLLRTELWLCLRHALVARAPTGAEVFVLGERLNFAVDAILGISLAEYERWGCGPNA
ncbi:MAG TPA: hypothetical protein VER55_09475 [Ardenticatenaceae bacterium]|nr:hypothetical protein [Ardenticatenaceae bacterium]